MKFKHFDHITEGVIVLIVGLALFICVNSLLG
jgi:hypothetical protein